MSIFKCKMCGGTIEFEQGATVGVCDSCGTKQTLPKIGDESSANLFNRANNLRLKCDFDKAAAIYEKIVENDDSETEAHWGLVLCKYGIEYVVDPASGKRVPTCHRTMFDAVTKDPDYLAAVDYSDPAQQEIYESEAHAIDRIQKGILAIVREEKPFDVFLCYKETDTAGKRTLDSTIANDIYHQLTQEGYKVFYAPITLEDKLGQDYEPYIFAALNSAKVMLVIGTKPEYFEAVWVKNEWSRYLKLMKDHPEKLLIPCYRDMDAYELPDEFAHMQAQDMSKIGFINDITRGIGKVIGNQTQNTAAPRSVAAETRQTSATTESLMKRAYLFLRDKDWSNTESYCNRILDIDPECSDAYLALVLAENRISNKENLPQLVADLSKNSDFQKALEFASGEQLSWLQDCEQSCRSLCQKKGTIEKLQAERSQVSQTIYYLKNELGQALYDANTSVLPKNKKALLGVCLGICAFFWIILLLANQDTTIYAINLIIFAIPIAIFGTIAVNTKDEVQQRPKRTALNFILNFLSVGIFGIVVAISLLKNNHKDEARKESQIVQISEEYQEKIDAANAKLQEIDAALSQYEK